MVGNDLFLYLYNKYFSKIEKAIYNLLKRPRFLTESLIVIFGNLVQPGARQCAVWLGGLCCVSSGPC